MPAVADGVASVDWTAPWMLPYRETGCRVAADLASGLSVAQALNEEIARRGSILQPPEPAPRLGAGPLRFVDQSELPADCAYEAYIAGTAQVPTRDNLHDLFNGLAWLRWPALKRHLNELQAIELGKLGVAAQRGPVRDALTLFDENAALLQLPPPLELALRAGDWHALFVRHRAAWADARVYLFGHALIEKLINPRKAITSHGWLLPLDLPADQLQSWLCEHLTAQRLASRAHLPLPVLGIPGWWQPNESADFYADRAVFRAQRKNHATAIIKP